MAAKYLLKKSFVAFLDILGFSERFSKDSDSCIELISFFAVNNGPNFDQISTTAREVRVSSLAFSDNIVVSIPVTIDIKAQKVRIDDLYVPIMSFLYAISLFTYKSLENGFYIRGAIAYGDMYQTDSEVAGEPYMEAVKHEKIAYYPRIILAPSALKIMDQIYQQDIYGMMPNEIRTKLNIEKGKIDNTTYFDWLNFFKNNPENHLEEDKKQEIKKTIGSAKIILSDRLLSTEKIEIQQKLGWMKNYLDCF